MQKVIIPELSFKEMILNSIFNFPATLGNFFLQPLLTFMNHNNSYLCIVIKKKEDMKEFYFRLKMISEELTNDCKEFLIGTYEGTRSNALAYFRRKTKGNVYEYMIEQYLSAHLCSCVQRKLGNRVFFKTP